MSTSSEPTDSLDTLDSLLRGELSAIETYSQAIHKFPESAHHSTLHALRSTHQANVGALRRMINRTGGDPPTSSGLWGTFAKAVEGTAALVGEALAIKALKEGEEHGIKEYEDAVDGNVSAAAAHQIREEILPTLRENVATLDGIIDRC